MGYLKGRIGMNIIVFIVSAVLVGGVFAAGADRIYPTLKVVVYKGDQKVGAYTREAPFPEGATLATEGRCAVKLGDLFLVAEDQSVFSSNASGRQRNLFVKEGIIYFKASGMKQPLTLVTPGGNVTIQRIRLDAAVGDQSVKGYVAVTENRGELGVVEGGSMDVLTDKGQSTLKAGGSMVLSQAEMDIGAPPEGEKPAEEVPPKPKEFKMTGKQIALATVGVVAGIGLIVGVAGGGGGGGGGGGSVSPSAP
ncbi:MAG: hypothetical protein WAM73_14985 [Desulfobacterales bacterium]